MGLAAGNSNHEKLFLELKLTLSSSGRGRGDPMLPWGGLRLSVLLPLSSCTGFLSRQLVSCLPRHRARHLPAHTLPAQARLPLPSKIKATSAGHTAVNPPHPVHSPGAGCEKHHFLSFEEFPEEFT